MLPLPRAILLLGLIAASPIQAGDSGSAGTQPSPRGRIALSFDDAPRPDGAFFKGAERTRRLIDALEQAGVSGAAVFVTTGNLERAPDGAERLRAWAAAGHVLGNHGHDHLWLSRSSVADYLTDIDTAVERLASFDGVVPYFRFPFLDEGRDHARRDALRSALAARGLANGYVTIDNYDWYLDHLAAEALRHDPDVDRDAIGRLYVDSLRAAVEFYDGHARRMLGRSPAHVLLLHENDLAALFVGDLVAALRADGWQVVPALEAWRDPIANTAPDTLFNGQGRIAALAHAAGTPAPELVHALEDEAALRARFVEAGLLPETPAASAAPRASAAAPEPPPWVVFDAPRLLLEGARIIAGDGSGALHGQSLLITGGRIRALGPDGSLDVPAGTRRIDLAGHTVIPGLAGLHNHLHMPGAPSLLATAARLYLAAGVTTIQTAGAADVQGELQLASDVQVGRLPGPAILPSAPYLGGPGDSAAMEQPADAGAARDFVRRWAARGVRWIKLYRHVSPEVAQAAIAEARRLGLGVTGHLCSLSYAEAANFGIHRIEHGFQSASDLIEGRVSGTCRSGLASLAATAPDDPRFDALIDTLVERGVVLSTTPAIRESRFPHRQQGSARELALLSPAWRDAHQRRLQQLGEQAIDATRRPGFLDLLRALERRFVAAGGLLVAGPDPGRHVLPGFGDQRNFELLVEAGFSTGEAVRILSHNGAVALGLGREKGRLAPGYAADLVVLRGDLEADASVIRAVRYVIQGGRVLDPEVLLEGIEGTVGPS